MHSLLDSTILVLSSKPSRNRFAKFNPNPFRFVRWNTALVFCDCRASVEQSGITRPPAKRCTVQLDNQLRTIFNWVAPEVLVGQPFSFASDVYSLCCVLWESVKGRPLHRTRPMLLPLRGLGPSADRVGSGRVESRVGPNFPSEISRPCGEMLRRCGLVFLQTKYRVPRNREIANAAWTDINVSLT